MTKDKRYGRQRAQERFEATLKGALSTAPKPLKAIKASASSASDASVKTVRRGAGKPGKSGQR
jgi:hypothetical protein